MIDGRDLHKIQSAHTIRWAQQRALARRKRAASSLLPQAGPEINGPSCRRMVAGCITIVGLRAKDTQGRA